LECTTGIHPSLGSKFYNRGVTEMQSDYTTPNCTTRYLHTPQEFYRHRIPISKISLLIYEMQANLPEELTQELDLIKQEMTEIFGTFFSEGFE